VCFVRNFASTIPRKFGARYNPYTLSVEILDNTNQMAKYAADIKGALLCSKLYLIVILLTSRAFSTYDLARFKVIVCTSHAQGP